MYALDLAISIKPDFFEAHINRGAVLSKLGNYSGAASALERAVSLHPQDPNARASLASVLAETNKIEEAMRHIDIVLAEHPEHGDAYNTLGVLNLRQQRYDDAIAMFEESIALNPKSYKTLNNLGTALRLQGRIAEALAAYERCLSINPRYAVAVSNLATCYKSMGRIDEAIVTYRRALDIQPDYVLAHSNLVYCHNFLPGITLSKLLEVHAEWDKSQAHSYRKHWGGYRNSKDPSRPLIIGFVSGDFRCHPVGHFTVRVIEFLAKVGVQVACYANQSETDLLTERFKRASFLWRNILGVSDDEAAAFIRQDQVDLLFDLTGHNAANRLLLFARKPAPVQITWAGYMATTGLAAMDYIVADRYHVPEGVDQYYFEKILRMSDSFVCFDPPADLPAIEALPLVANGYVTFGCFNIVDKLNVEVIGLWSRVLKRIPRSRLVLKAWEFNCSVTRRRYSDMFLQHSIGSERLEFVGGTPHREHLGWYKRIDIALDPFPFSGSTTTLEALCMGVPVVTMPGETFASRHSLSFLSSVGLGGLAAGNAEQYVDIACSLAAEPKKLSALRAQLRQAVRDSPLCDSEKFGREFMAKCCSAWVAWCASD